MVELMASSSWGAGCVGKPELMAYSSGCVGCRIQQMLPAEHLEAPTAVSSAPAGTGWRWDVHECPKLRFAPSKLAELDESLFRRPEAVQVGTYVRQPQPVQVFISKASQTAYRGLQVKPFSDKSVLEALEIVLPWAALFARSWSSDVIVHATEARRMLPCHYEMGVSALAVHGLCAVGPSTVIDHLQRPSQCSVYSACGMQLAK